MGAIAIRVGVGVAFAGFGIVTSILRAGGWVVLDDEVIPIRDPEVAVGSDFGSDG